jgi:hypothetical protein
MRLYFISDTGHCSVTCGFASSCEVIRVMEAQGYHEATPEQHLAQVMSMRNAERRDDAARERDERKFKNECRGRYV